jgi:FkbM family methyltransferase
MNHIKKIIKNKLGIATRSPCLPLTLRKYLKKRHPIYLVDIGAHQGYFTRNIENYCGIVKAALIEPLPDKAEYLRKSFSSSQYRVFEGVVSSENGKANFEINEYDQTSSILSIDREMYELSQVKLSHKKNIFRPAFTLDRVLEEIRFPRLDLLKIDVQGAEHLVIDGASETLKYTSMIWTEVSFKPLYKGSSTFSDIYQILSQKGFRLTEIEPGFRSPDGELLQGDALFLR